MTATMGGRITRSDLREQLRAVRDEADEGVQEVLPAAVAAGAGMIGVAVSIAYLLGSRKEKKRRTIVEVKRL